MLRSLLAAAAAAGLILSWAGVTAPAAEAAPQPSPQSNAATEPRRHSGIGGPVQGTSALDGVPSTVAPAVSSGGVFSDARDSAIAAFRFSPAVSRDGAFSDARDTAIARSVRRAAG